MQANAFMMFILLSLSILSILSILSFLPYSFHPVYALSFILLYPVHPV